MFDRTCRIGVRRLSRFALPVLAFALPAVPHRALAAVRVLESDARHVVVELRPEEPLASRLSGPNGDYIRLRIPGAGMTVEPGRPEVPEGSFQVGVPPGTHPRLTVVRQQWSASRPGAITPLPVRVGVEDPFGPDEVVEQPPVEGPEYTELSQYPARPFELSPMRDLRGLTTVNVLWRGVIAETAARTHRVLQSAVLEVTFDPDIQRIPAPTTRPAPPDELWERTRAWPLVNAGEAKHWARRLDPDGPSVGDTPWGPGTQFKVRIDDTGPVRITYADLAAAGFPAGVPVGQLSVYQRRFAMDSVDVATVPAQELFRPIPVPVLVRDDGNGVFDGSDSILLYGRSFRDEWMTSGWEWEDLFEGDNFYWVRVDPAGGARMASLPAQPASAGADSLTSTPSKYFREDDTRYMDRPPDFGPGGQSFESDFFFRNNSATPTGGSSGWTFSDPFPVNDPVPGVADTLVARVLPAGKTVYGSYSNVLDYTVNSTALGQDGFRNTDPYQNMSVVQPQAVLWKHAIPAGVLFDGSNTFDFRGRSYDAAGAPSQVTRFLFDWYEIRYERQLVARGDQLLLDTRNGTTAEQRIRVRGFSGDTDLLLLDVTDPANPATVPTAGQSVPGAGGGFDLRFGHDNATGPGTYLAIRESVVPSVPVADLQAVSQPTLLAGGVGARWVAVAYDDFVPGVQPLAALRNGKYSTLVTPLSQVWDVFGMGGRNPIALKAYAAYAYHRWSDPIAFLCLIGDASEDHKGVGFRADPDFVPSHSLWAQYEGDPEETDQYYAEVTRAGPGQPWDDLSDLYVGRLPVGDLGELDWNVMRIVQYETTDPDGAWRHQAVLLADDAISGDLGGSFSNSYTFKPGELAFCEATRGYAESMLADPYDELQPTVLCMSQWSHPCADSCYYCGPIMRYCNDPLYCDPDTISCEAQFGIDCGNWYRCRTSDSCYDLEPNDEHLCSVERMRATGHVALRDRLNAGALLWNFEGHAHRWFLTHEQIWYDGIGSTHDADLLKNWGKPFIFLGFACHLAEWDKYDENGQDCMAEKMMNKHQTGAPPNQPGGCIAVFASSGFEFLSPNLDFNEDVLNAFYYPELAADGSALDGGGATLPPVGDGTTYRWTLGESTTRARLMFQNRNAATGQTRQAAQRFVLLGDPALEPNTGAPGLEVTVNGVAVKDPSQRYTLNPDDFDQVELTVTASDGRGIAGWTVTDAGAVVAPAQYEITVPDSADVSRDGVPRRQMLRYAFVPRRAGAEYDIVVGARDGSGTEARFDIQVTRTFQFDPDAEPAVYPSPFSDETWFVYRATQDVDDIRVDVYTITGRRIRELHDGSLPANVQLKLPWDGTDGNGRSVANGTYFIVAQATSGSQTDRRVVPVVKMR